MTTKSKSSHHKSENKYRVRTYSVDANRHGHRRDEAVLTQLVYNVFIKQVV